MIEDLPPSIEFLIQFFPGRRPVLTLDIKSGSTPDSLKGFLQGPYFDRLTPYPVQKFLAIRHGTGLKTS
jgi:hypothetical protein